jgi:prepilin peptidase CpaA
VITPSQEVAIAVTLIASVTDIKSRKIPNWLTFPGMLAGVLCQWWQAGSISGFFIGIEGWLVAMALMLGTYFLSVVLNIGGKKTVPVGFGDIKLEAVIGACLGPERFLFQLIVFGLLFVGFGMARAILLSVLEGKSGAQKSNRVITLLKTPTVMAPFIALATVATVFFYMPLAQLQNQ